MMADGIEYVDLGSDDPSVIACKASGKITADAMAGLIGRLESVQASGHKARIYVDLTDYKGSDLSVAKEKLAHMGTFWNGIERCAYVVDKGWMSTVIGLVDAVTPMHLRAFDPDQDADARTWVLDKT
jgi:hypothetical protein